MFLVPHDDGCAELRRGLKSTVGHKLPDFERSMNRAVVQSISRGRATARQEIPDVQPYERDIFAHVAFDQISESQPRVAAYRTSSARVFRPSFSMPRDL
jgi:hypothetical protein